jgi:hypothetical protein
MNPVAEVEEYEQPGPPPRRHLTPAGKWIVALAFIIPAAIVLTLLVMMPSRFGVSPG